MKSVAAQAWRGDVEKIALHVRSPEFVTLRALIWVAVFLQAPPL
jgi:hypothetical protein